MTVEEHSWSQHLLHSPQSLTQSGNNVSVSSLIFILPVSSFSGLMPCFPHNKRKYQHGNTWFGTIQFQVRTIQIQVVTRELQLGTVWFQGQDNKFRNSESVFCPKFRNYLVINILEAHSCELWFTHEKLQYSVILELSSTNFAGTREFQDRTR